MHGAGKRHTHINVAQLITFEFGFYNGWIWACPIPAASSSPYFANKGLVTSALAPWLAVHRRLLRDRDTVGIHVCYLSQ